MTRFLIALAALLLPFPALAQAMVDDLEGTWDFRVDDVTIFRFVLEQDEAGKDWRGTWQRPDRFRTNGEVFSDVGGEVERLRSAAGYEFLGSVELSFDDPRPGAVPDIFRFRRLGDDAVEMIYVGTGLAPYSLVRAEAEDPIGNWQAGRIYSRGEQPAEPPVNAPGEPAEPAAPAASSGGMQIIDLPRYQRATLSPRPALPPAPIGPPDGAQAPEDAPAATEPPTEDALETEAAEAERPRIDADFLDGF